MVVALHLGEGLRQIQPLVCLGLTQNRCKVGVFERGNQKWARRMAMMSAIALRFVMPRSSSTVGRLTHPELDEGG